LEAIGQLPKTHPYQLAGQDSIRNAIQAFCEICEEGRYPYVLSGGLERPENRRILTCAGTMKPSCLVPQSMSMDAVENAEHVLIVGIEGLKDFYPRFVSRGISRFVKGKVETIMLPCPSELATFPGNRDLSTLDAARLIDTYDGHIWFIEALQRDSHFASLKKEKTVVLVPPILGETNSYNVRDSIEDALGVSVFELVAPPPAVSGLRLRNVLIEALHKAGVSVILNARASAPEYADDGKSVSSMLVESAGRVRRIKASSFVIATGGVYGGGINVRPDSVLDVLFGNRVDIIPSIKPLSEHWAEETAYPDFSAGVSHGFASLGVRVDSGFRPVDVNGAPIFSNVYFVGRSVGGYDSASEKSGNGVALVSAYAVSKQV